MAIKLNISPIETHQLTMLGIADNSDFGNATPANISFEITAPGFNKKNVPFQPKSINIFTSGDLGLGCDDSELPDGIYTVKYTANNEFIEKQFIRISKLQYKSQKLALSLVSGECDTWQTYKSVKLMIEGAVAAGNDCQMELATSLMTKANELLKKSKNCC